MSSYLYLVSEDGTEMADCYFITIDEAMEARDMWDDFRPAYGHSVICVKDTPYEVYPIDPSYDLSLQPVEEADKYNRLLNEFEGELH